jgi:hypothetical protein
MKIPRSHRCLPVLVVAGIHWIPTLHADLAVNQDLDIMEAGTVNISHDTTLGTNNTDAYFSSGSHSYGNKIVLQFTIENRHILNLTSVALTGDHDFFLLDSLSTAINDAGLRFATGTLAGT